MSIDSIGDFLGDFIWLKSLNFVLLSHVISSSDLVWHGVDLNLWDLLGDLVLLSHVLGDLVGVSVIGGVEGLITILSVVSAMSVVSMSMSVGCWVGFFTITRVEGVLTNSVSLDWDISSPGLVLGSVGDLLFLSVGSLVGDDGNLSGLLGDDCSVLGVVLSVVSRVRLSSVLGLMLNSVLGIKDSIVAGLLIGSILN